MLNFSRTRLVIVTVLACVIVAAMINVFDVMINVKKASIAERKALIAERKALIPLIVDRKKTALN